MVSGAKSAGGLVTLYPNGNIADAPWPLVEAVAHALTILGYYEMQDDDRPPQTMWMDPEALSVHFEQVRQKYAAKAGGNWEPVQDVPMVENELTKGLRG